MLQEPMGETRQYAMAKFFGHPPRDMVSSYVPHAGRLRIQVAEAGPGFAVLTLPYHEELVGDPTRGVVFGGVITTLIDQTCGVAVACALETLRPFATIDLRIDYLRTATPGCDLHARAECYKVTRSVAFVRARAYESDPADAFASCAGTFMLGVYTVGGASASDESKAGRGPRS
jgi:uncharacterized protein (TIGR00369 family)